MAKDAKVTIGEFLDGKSASSTALFEHFMNQFQQVGNVNFLPAKTMIGISTTHKKVAYVTQFGKNFIHIVFPFKQPYADNLCFQKIAQVPGQQQYNHHLRVYSPDDINEEVIGYMQLACKTGP